MENIILFSDSSRGIYIPKHFAECVQRKYVCGVDESDLDYLADENNMTDDHYWDTWQDVLDNCYLMDHDNNRFVLHQDGDLWLLNYDAMTDEELNNFYGEL